jgi:hypothetical protein
MFFITLKRLNLTFKLCLLPDLQLKFRRMDSWDIRQQKCRQEAEATERRGQQPRERTKQLRLSFSEINVMKMSGFLKSS